LKSLGVHAPVGSNPTPSAGQKPFLGPAQPSSGRLMRAASAGGAPARGSCGSRSGRGTRDGPLPLCRASVPRPQAGRRAGALAELITEVNAGGHRQTRQYTVSELLDRWMDHIDHLAVERSNGPFTLASLQTFTPSALHPVGTHHR
jgi:hypothetical protein